MAAVTICSDFGAQKNKVWHCFHCFPVYFPWSDGTRWSVHMTIPNFLTIPLPPWRYIWKWKSLSHIQLFETHGLNSPWNSPGQNTRVGSLSLLQGIFPTQGSNPGLPHCGRILYQLSHKVYWTAQDWIGKKNWSYPFIPLALLYMNSSGSKESSL